MRLWRRFDLAMGILKTPAWNCVCGMHDIGKITRIRVRPEGGRTGFYLYRIWQHGKQGPWSSVDPHEKASSNA